MIKNMYFKSGKPEELIEKMKKKTVHFQNLHNLYWFNKNKLYNKLLSKEYCVSYPDGKFISLRLLINQQRGPEFTERFLNSDLAKNKKHFFIGLKKEDVDRIVKIMKIDNKYIQFTDIPFIKEIEFELDERNKIISKIKKFKPDFIWLAIGSPKQDILSCQLYKEYPCFYFNVGAAFDFLLKKKKEAPRIFTYLGLEWFYRLITDFKNAKIKVLRSLLALTYLKNIKLIK